MADTARAAVLARLQEAKALNENSKMPLTKDFHETVRARAERDPAFREALFQETVQALRYGDIDNGCATLHAYINATVGFEATMQVSKWGSCLAVRLPKALVDRLGLKEGDELNLIVARNGAVEVETKEDRRQAALDRMASPNWTLPSDYKFDRDEANER